MSILKKKFSPAAPYAMVPVRIALFLIFFYHGTQMLFGLFGGLGLEGTGEFLGSLGVPLPSVAAFALALVQTLGSIAFLVGAGVRLFSLLITGVMLGGIFTVHWGSGFSILNGGIEYNLAIIGMCMTLLLGGPGWASIEWADEEGAAPQTVS